MRLQSFRRAILLGAALSGANLTYAHAQSDTFALPQSVQAFGPEVTLQGAAQPTDTVTFQVALQLRDKDALDAKVARGERLTPAQLEADHLPSPAAYQAVRGWLTGQGLAVDQDTDDRLMLEVHGTAEQVSRALGVTLSRVSVGGRSYVATADTPHIPAALSPYVVSVNGLQPYQHMNRLGMSSTRMLRRSASAAPQETISGDYLPEGILRAYKAAGYLTQDGTGTTTAILIDTVPNTSDLTQFWSLAGSTQTLADVTFVKLSKTLPAASGEETLDTEWASSMAPASKVRVYAAGSLAFTALDVGFHRMLTNIKGGIAITQLSISLGACETGVSAGQVKTDEALLESLAAEGVSIFVSTGDQGATECGSGNGLHPAYYSTSPYVTAVGGTSLVLTASSETSPATIKSETAWSGSGGGISSLFAKPSWQSATSYAARTVPDVAAVADPNTGVVIVLNGQEEEVGGTSAATPIWAGLMSLVNQGRLVGGHSTLELLNSRIYPLVKTVNFRDTTRGNNGGYTAAVGYDLTTGLGSPVMNQLFETLLNSTP